MMDNTGKLAIFSAAALAVLLARRAFSVDAPINATALERQVMRHKDLIWRMGLKHDTDPALIAAIMAAESSGRSQPARLIYVRNYAGEEVMDYVAGLMQVRLDTANIYCDIWHQHDLQQDGPNVECGVKYLRAMLDQFGKVHLAVSAYNAGAGSIVYDSSMVGGMQFVNIKYMRRVLGMIQRFRLLFMSSHGADAYMRLFPPQKWSFEIP
jgi:soluble lytic murein transglycosylase-like protein